MKVLSYLAAFLIVCLPSGVIAQNATSFPDQGDYRLGIGDTLRIEVHQEPDLTLQIQLQGNGVVDYPFLGKITAVNRSVDELRTIIVSGLKGDYLINPDVRVRVVNYRPFYVTGAVRKPGGYPFVMGLTVEKAITLAGGHTDRASLRNIFRISEKSTQDEKVSVSLDAYIFPGDTIVVEESFF